MEDKQKAISETILESLVLVEVHHYQAEDLVLGEYLREKGYLSVEHRKTKLSDEGRGLYNKLLQCITEEVKL